MYCQSIVTFIDILGFKDIVKNRTCDQIDVILDTLNHFASRSSNDNNSLEPTVLSFSDSIVRVRNLESEENIAFPVGHLYYEVNALVHAQMDLVNNGVLIRGGITIGNASVTNDRIFGPAFINAYELESKFANYPRIILSPEVVNAVGTDLLVVNENHSADEERKYLRSQLACGDDGLWFIDYLRASKYEMDEPNFYPKFLAHHKSLIVTEGQLHSSLSDKSAKYIWLANYHNKVVSELNNKSLQTRGIDRNALSISYNEMATLTSL